MSLALNTVQYKNHVKPITFCNKTFYCCSLYDCTCTCPYVSNVQIKEYARAIHNYRDCSTQQQEECTS